MSGPTFWGFIVASLPGSWIAVRRVAARRRERGREVLFAVLLAEVENGRGAGSGQVSVCVVKSFAVGICRLSGS